MGTYVTPNPVISYAMATKAKGWPNEKKHSVVHCQACVTRVTLVSSSSFAQDIFGKRSGKGTVVYIFAKNIREGEEFHSKEKEGRRRGKVSGKRKTKTKLSGRLLLRSFGGSM